MATKDWNGFKKSGDTYIPNDATARTALALKAGTTNLDDDDFLCLMVGGQGSEQLSRVTIKKDSVPTEGSEKSIESGAVYTALQDKVDKVTGKGLSTNDYDDTAKAIVDTAQNSIKANTQLIADTVGWSGKNKLSNTASSSGIFTVNADKTITANGTPQSDVYIRPYIFEAGSLPSGDYILSGCPDGGSASKYEIQLYDSTTGTVTAHNYGGNTPVTVDDTHRYGVLVYVRTGTVASDLLFKPMLRDASILDPTYEPYRGTTAFPRDEQAIVGADNLMPSTIYALNTASAEVGDSTFTTYEGVQSFIAPIKRNTTYTLSRANGNRFRVALSTSLPANGIACNVLINADINEYTFNSGNYDYVFVMMNAGSETYDNIKPVLNVGSVARPFVPYAMTNRELTEFITPVSKSFGQVVARKIGGTVSLSFTGTTVVDEDGKTLGTLDADFRPNITFSITCKINNGSAYVDAQVRVNSSTGKVELMTLSGGIVEGALLNFLLCSPIFLR